MFKKLITVTALSVALSSSVASAVENNLIIDIMPLSFTAHDNVDGFENNIYVGGYRSGYSEKIEGVGSISPNISIGYGLDLPYFSIDATVGAGYLANGAFTASYFQGELTAYVTTKHKGFMIGPFYRLIDFSDPTWSTDNLDMKMIDNTTSTVSNAFGNANAYAYGIAMMTGGKKVKFKLKVSRLNDANMYVTGRNGYVPESNYLSMDGVSVELGLALRF